MRIVGTGMSQDTEVVGFVDSDGNGLTVTERTDGRVTVTIPAAAAASSSSTRAQDTSYRIGREWWTDFSSGTDDAVWATPTNLTYGTDGGLSSVTNTVAGTLSSFFTKDTSIRDFEVLLKWRASVDSGFDITNIESSPTGRRLNDNNRWIAKVQLTDGNSVAQIHSYKAGADAASSSAAVDNADSTHYRWTKFRVVGDVAYVKHWFDNADEPDWQVIRRLRAPLACSGATAANDNQDFGACGFQQRYGGTVQQVRITELLRSDSNLLISPSPTHIDTTDGWPVVWYPTKDSGDTADVVSVVDPWGDTSNAFRLIKVGTSTSCFWTQDLWSGGPDSFITRNSPHPRVKFPRAVEVSLWSKGTGITAPGSLSSALVAYQYNTKGTILNLGDQFYYATLGPNGAVAGAGGKKGDGTWGWTRTVWRMPLATTPETLTRMRIDIGIHDTAATGQLLFKAGEIRPVP